MSSVCARLFLIIAVGLLVRAGTLLANEAHRQLMASPEEDRRGAFKLILVGAGERCETITRTYFQGETSRNEAVWNIDCGADGAYSVSIAPDEGGSTKLITCSALQRLKGTECFKPLPVPR